MWDMEYDVMQVLEGYIPHCVCVLFYMKQLWDVVIGGLEEFVLDGMFGSVLKMYCEVF